MKKHFTQILFLVGALAIASSAKADFPPIQIEATDTVYGAVEKAWLGYSMDIVGNQLFVGAASTAVDAESGSSSVFIYNITDEGKAEQVQVIKAPTEADKKFFGYILSATDNYLAVLASSTAKKVYVYEKQADSSWSSEPIGSLVINGAPFTLAIDGNRIVVVEGENKYAAIYTIEKDGEGNYSFTPNAIAEGEHTAEDGKAIKISPTHVAIKDNALVIYVKNQGLFIYEYNTAENSWKESAFVSLEEKTNANAPQSVAISNEYISVVNGSNKLFVLEKTGESWASNKLVEIETANVTKSWHTAINGNFIAVADNNGGGELEHNGHYAEFYTKVNDVWTLVKYAYDEENSTKSVISMSNAFNGKYYASSGQLVDKNEQTQNAGAFSIYKFITDIDYTAAADPQPVNYSGEEYKPELDIDIAPEYNAEITYSLEEDGIYTSEVPSFTAEGVYTIYYKITAEGYNDVINSVEFEIIGDVTAFAIPIQIEATDTEYGAGPNAYLGYSIGIVGDQLFVGAARGANEAESVSNRVFIYNITDEGKAEQVQVIKAPTEADKKFFGYALSVTDNYLAVLATAAKKVYVYGKQADSSWSSDTIGSFDITVNTLAIDGNRIVVAEGENKYATIYTIEKDGEGNYSFTPNAIAEGEHTAEDGKAIKISPTHVAIKDNALVIYVRNQGLFIYEYNTTESNWKESAFVSLEEKTNTNVPQSVAISNKYISVVNNKENLFVLEKTGESWASNKLVKIKTANVTGSYRTAINGNFIAVADNNSNSITNGHYAEFYTKVNDVWTLVKYAHDEETTNKSVISMSNAFNGKYYATSGQLVDKNGTGSGAFSIYKFITDIDYTAAADPQPVNYSGEKYKPELDIDIAPQYNAEITYSLEEDGTYTSDVPSFTAEGVYTIYYKITAEGYNEVINSVEFEIIGNATAVANVEQTNIGVYAVGKKIIVENADGESVNVFNVLGSNVYATESAETKQTIAIEKSGIYIVKVGEKAYKILVK